MSRVSRVSILTPVYNGANSLDTYRQQVYAQSKQPDYVVLYDDGSTDSTRAALQTWSEEDSRVHVIGSATNRGRGYARQKLLDAARTEFVSWLDVDDRWHPRTLETQSREYSIAERGVQAPVLLCSPYYQISLRQGGERFISLPRTYVIEDYLRLARDKNNVAMLQCTFGRTVDYARVGFDVALNWSEDFDFFLRFLAAGGRIAPQADQSVAVGYLHTMVGQDMEKVMAAHDYIYETHSDLWPAPPEPVIEKYLRRLRYVLYGYTVSGDGAGAERVLVEAAENLDSEAFAHEIRAGARRVLKAYSGDSVAYLKFAHAWANRGKRVRCTPVDRGYRLTSSRTDRVRWKTAEGSVADGGVLGEQDVWSLYLSGVRSVTGVERLDGGSRRAFGIRALPGGRVGLMPSST